MSSAPTASAGNTWLLFTFITILSWGVYGILLHKGQALMQPTSGPKMDPSILRYKAFLFVGLAYFLTAVLAPLAILMKSGTAFTGYTSSGALWSLIAGTAGAIGAFGVLLAFGAKGTPPVVMALVFAGAPLINAILSTALHPPAGGWVSVKPQFWLGILLALSGGYLVARYNPGSPAPKKPAVTQSSEITTQAPSASTSVPSSSNPDKS